MISLALFIASASLLYNVVLQFMVRNLNKRLSSVELGIIRGIMEDDPDIANRVVITQIDLRARGGMTSSDAMRESRKLHGLPK